MFSFPVIELVDRYTIAQVKYNRTQEANQAELDFYQTQVDLLDIQSIATELTALRILHNKIAEILNDPVREIKTTT